MTKNLILQNIKAKDISVANGKKALAVAVEEERARSKNVLDSTIASMEEKMDEELLAKDRLITKTNEAHQNILNENQAFYKNEAETLKTSHLQELTSKDRLMQSADEAHRNIMNEKVSALSDELRKQSCEAQETIKELNKQLLENKLVSEEAETRLKAEHESSIESLQKKLAQNYNDSVIETTKDAVQKVEQKYAQVRLRGKKHLPWPSFSMFLTHSQTIAKMQDDYDAKTSAHAQQQQESTSNQVVLVERLTNQLAEAESEMTRESQFSKDKTEELALLHLQLVSHQRMQALSRYETEKRLSSMQKSSDNLTEQLEKESTRADSKIAAERDTYKQREKILKEEIVSMKSTIEDITAKSKKIEKELYDSKTKHETKIATTVVESEKVKSVLQDEKEAIKQKHEESIQVSKRTHTVQKILHIVNC